VSWTSTACTHTIPTISTQSSTAHDTKGDRRRRQLLESGNAMTNESRGRRARRRGTPATSTQSTARGERRRHAEQVSPARYSDVCVMKGNVCASPCVVPSPCCAVYVLCVLVLCGLSRAWRVLTAFRFKRLRERRVESRWPGWGLAVHGAVQRHLDSGGTPVVWCDACAC
jgi:hypothetical protein